jgi:RNA polymerase sigma factor (sigma-70 family)
MGERHEDEPPGIAHGDPLHRRLHPRLPHVFGRRPGTGRVEYREDVDELILASTHNLIATPAQQVEAEESFDELRAAAATLDADLREVVQLFYWADMPQKRAAAFLDLPVTTVQWRLHTARKTLRERLGRCVKEEAR